MRFEIPGGAAEVQSVVARFGVLLRGQEGLRVRVRTSRGWRWGKLFNFEEKVLGMHDLQIKGNAYIALEKNLKQYT